MELNVAKQWAEEYYSEMGVGVGKTVLDDGEYYIFGPDKSIDCSCMFAASKKSDKKINYFPPDHPKFVSAKKIKLK